jgi:pimeloyl-ACP methyl ester carboxylesterase
VSRPGGLRYETYRAAGLDEWMMRLGDPAAPAILFLPSLFEELNRTRALIAGTMRALAAEGFQCLLPDLPGTGESERALGEVNWEEWREAARSAAGTVTLSATAAVRGGCLLDDVVDAPCRWRLTPVDGASLVRDLERAGMAAGGGLAGYAPGEALLAAVREARPRGTGARVARLASDPAEADARIEGSPVWRRPEPEAAPALGGRMAEDIAAWVRTCAG